LSVAHVLIIEDDVAVGKLLQKHLESRRHEVVVAHSGEAGLMALGLSAHTSVTLPPLPSSFTPALLVCDLALPAMSGAAVIEIVRAEAATRLLPIVVVSGRAAVHDHALALEAGADVFLPKPVRLKDLDRVVEELLGGSRL
jgi:DNA-binding response OmpR family regulator